MQNTPALSSSLVDNTQNFFSRIKVPYALITKTMRCAKDTHELATYFLSVSKDVSEILRLFEPIKVLHIPIYSIKSVRAASRVFISNSVELRVLGLWKVYKSIKKILSGVSAFVGVLERTISLTPRIGGYLQQVSFFFFPVTLVGAVVGSYKIFQRSCLLLESNTYIKKEMTCVEDVVQACVYIQNNRQRLQHLKVFTKKNELQTQVCDLYDRIQKTKTVLPSDQALLNKMRGRIKHQLIREILRTAIKITSAVAMILAATNALSLFSLALLEAVCSVGGLGIYLYAKHMPLQGASRAYCPCTPDPAPIQSRKFEKIIL